MFCVTGALDRLCTRDILWGPMAPSRHVLMLHEEYQLCVCTTDIAVWDCAQENRMCHTEKRTLNVIQKHNSSLSTEDVYMDCSFDLSTRQIKRQVAKGTSPLR